MAKGKKTGGGSRRGVPNKVTADLKDMILGALNRAGGEVYLTTQARESPAAFLSLIGRCLPKDVNLDAKGAITVKLITGLPEPRV